MGPIVLQQYYSNDAHRATNSYDTEIETKSTKLYRNAENRTHEFETEDMEKGEDVTVILILYVQFEALGAF